MYIYVPHSSLFTNVSFTPTTEVCPEILVKKGHVADMKPTLAPKDLASIIAEYDGLIVRSATKVYKYFARLRMNNPTVLFSAAHINDS